jgi:hypothetical protein
MGSFRFVLVLGVLVMSAGPHRAAADVVKTQTPCDGPCISLGPGIGGFFTARRVTFHAPGPGTAIVSFQGVLYCLSNNPLSANFWIETQIVKTEAPSGHGPGGLELLASTEPYDGNSRTFTINLASQRVFVIRSARTETYRLRVYRGFLADTTGCSVRNGAFTVHFVE